MGGQYQPEGTSVSLVFIEYVVRDFHEVGVAPPYGTAHPGRVELV